MESKESKYYGKKNKYERLKKDFSLSSFMGVMKYSFQGYVHFYKYERSAILHLIIAVVIILGSLSLDMSVVEWLFMIFILLTMLAIELINTSIEAVCDLVCPEYNRLVKIAKDTASAATFSISIALVIAIFIIYVPKIISFLGL